MCWKNWSRKAIFERNLTEKKGCWVYDDIFKRIEFEQEVHIATNLR